MRIAIIGRTEWLLNTAELLLEEGYEIPLVITAKEAPEYKVTREDFKKFAEKAQAKFYSGANILDEKIVSGIKSVGNLDLAVSINYSGIIPKEIIDCFNIGILNLHGGDLPKYKGNACQAWAIINGESQIGLCVHKMIGGELDNGDIISKDYFQLSENTRIKQVYDWMEDRGVSLMLEAVKKLEINPHYILEKQSQNPKDSLRCYPRIPEDGKIDWHKSNIEILRLINASSEPFSGAFSTLEGEKIIIWRAEIYKDDEIYLAVPGQVAEILNNGVVIICGQGKLLLTDVELNEIRGNPSQFIHSIRKRLR